MKIILLTNQASYHQMHYARQMAALLGAENFRIVFHKPTSPSRREMGWSDSYTDSFILRYWHAHQRAEALSWIDAADVVIQGRFPIDQLRRRIRGGKLTFACQERLWKRPPSLRRKLSRAVHLLKNYYSVNRPNYHLLAIGAYAAQDLNAMGLFVYRSWRFGYFIDAPESARKVNAGPGLNLLWCARFSEVKQPAMALVFLNKLINAGKNVSLKMIGDGELRSSIEAQAVDMGLANNVVFTGWQTQQQVISHMLASDLFLMTSHHGEGWGLVVNEAMSYGCSVVANQDLGAARWLVQTQKTGWLYGGQNIDAVVAEIASMDNDEIKSYGQAAAQRMQQLWSAKVAAERTVTLCESLLEPDDRSAHNIFADGPCSPI